MNLCELPNLVLMKVLRYLDQPAISNTMTTGSFLYKTIRDNHHRLAKSRMFISITESKCGLSMITVNRPGGIERNFHFVHCKDQLRLKNVETILFTSDWDLHTKMGEMVDNFLRRTNPKQLRLFGSNENLLQKISASMQSNRTLVHTLDLHTPHPLSPSSLRQFIESMHGVEVFLLMVHPLSLSEEILKMPQICSAVDRVKIKASKDEFRLSLTDSDILAFSAMNLVLDFEWDCSPNFFNAFRQKFLSRKITGSASRFPRNYIRLDTTRFLPEIMFDGVKSLHLDPEIKIGSLCRDDGVALIFHYDEPKFQYTWDRAID